MADDNGFEKAQQVLNEHGEELKKKYGVNHIALGYKIDGTELSHKISLICYFYDDKNSRLQINMPKEIDGVTLDVKVVDKFKQR